MILAYLQAAMGEKTERTIHMDSRKNWRRPTKAWLPGRFRTGGWAPDRGIPAGANKSCRKKSYLKDSLAGRCVARTQAVLKSLAGHHKLTLARERRMRV